MTAGRSTAGRAGRVVEPRREVLEASSVEGAWSLIEPTRDVVEVHDHDHGVLYILEPVPVRPDGDRQAVVVLDDLSDVDDAAGTAGVLTRPAVGALARFAPLPAPPVVPPLPQRHTQYTAAERWQVTHALGYRPTFECHTFDGRLLRPDNIEHPVPGQISEIVFGAPFPGYADPA